MKDKKYISRSEQETVKLGYDFASGLKMGDLVAFYGDLGTGKTEFIKGICEYFEVEEIVTSPTFTIINHYTGTVNDDEFQIYHIDLYRIEDVKELIEIGFQDCIHTPNTIKLIEWAEKAGNQLPLARYNVIIDADQENEEQRAITIENKYIKQYLAT